MRLVLAILSMLEMLCGAFTISQAIDPHSTLGLWLGTVFIGIGFLGLLGAVYWNRYP